VPRPEGTRRYNCNGDCAHGTSPISKPSRPRPGAADQPDKSRLRLVLLVPADAWASAAASGVEPPSHALLAVSDVPGDSASPLAANRGRISSTFPADPGVAARLSRAELAEPGRDTKAGCGCTRKVPVRRAWPLLLHLRLSWRAREPSIIGRAGRLISFRSVQRRACLCLAIARLLFT
jgi:hypothetical protein